MDMSPGISAGIGAIVSGLIVLANSIRTSGRQEQKIETHEIKLKEHDENFKGLDTRFMPRGEISAKLDNIGSSVERTESWLKALVLGKTKPE